MDNDVPVWGIHGGRTGDADELFLKHERIGLGWIRVGSLLDLPADRERIKAVLAELYPEKKTGAIPVDAGQLYRFAHEMKLGDLVAYPSKVDRQVHIGRVDGGYEYDRQREPGYPHQRRVKWLRSFPRTHFSQAALYEIGSSMSLFQMRNYAEEFRAAVVGKPTTAVAEDDESTVALIAEDIEANTRDFILKRLSHKLKGHPFAEFVAHLLEVMGYRTRVSPEGADRGIDIVAHRDELGFEPPIIKVQVKSGDGKVGDPAVTALYGKVTEREYGLFVTLSSFTNQAKSFADSKSNLRLLDADELVSLFLEYYDRLGAQYKGLVPLKRVYIPEAIKDEDR